jgi:hypothetical protein
LRPADVVAGSTSGTLRKSLEAFETWYAAEPNPLSGIDRFLLTDELGEMNRRDRILEEFCARFQDKSPKTVSICRMIRDSLADGGKRPLDLAAVDRVLESIPPRPGGIPSSSSESTSSSTANETPRESTSSAARTRSRRTVGSG